VVKNLGIYVDGRLSWRKQVSCVVSRTFSTLLYRFPRYTSRDLKIYLVRSLILPIFLYSDVVYFPSLTRSEFRRLQLVFNACTRYVYGLQRFDHIFEFSREILGCNCSNIWNFDWLRGDSALYRGIFLWNVLPFAAKSSFSIGTFKREQSGF
jgi:hypothetical protein